MKRVNVVRSTGVAALLMVLSTTSAGVGQDAAPLGYAPENGETNTDIATDPTRWLGNPRFTPKLEPELTPAWELDWTHADLGPDGVIHVKIEEDIAAETPRAKPLTFETMNEVLSAFMDDTFTALNYANVPQPLLNTALLSGAAAPHELGLFQDGTVVRSPLPKTIRDENGAVDVAATFDASVDELKKEITSVDVPLPRRVPAALITRQRIAAMSEEFGFVTMDSLPKETRGQIDLAQIEASQGAEPVRIAQYTLANLGYKAR
ncbi:MAG TPA: hypothetical protein VIN59_04560 [Alphaproteobacteria bacterium]